jgi:hypothetical protein
MTLARRILSALIGFALLAMPVTAAGRDHHRFHAYQEFASNDYPEFVCDEDRDDCWPAPWYGSDEDEEPYRYAPEYGHPYEYPTYRYGGGYGYHEPFWGNHEEHEEHEHHRHHEDDD